MNFSDRHIRWVLDNVSRSIDVIQDIAQIAMPSDTDSSFTDRSMGPILILGNVDPGVT